jgi:hypothetical protein
MRSEAPVLVRAKRAAKNFSGKMKKGSIEACYRKMTSIA